MEELTGMVIEHYKFERELGRGSFGVTYLAINILSNEQVAIKTINLETAKRNGSNIQLINEEINTLIDLTNDNQYCDADLNTSYLNVHNNIACYYDTFTRNINETYIVFIVTEYIKGISLRDFIINNDGILQPNVMWPLFVQLVNGLKYIHDRGYSHRDIKPSNILITSDYIIKYIDFGLACVGRCKNNTKCSNICRGKPGTIYYMPPEYFSSKYKSSLSAAKSHDIWSLGVVMFEMANGNKKYPYMSNEILNNKIIPLKKDKIVKNIANAPTYYSNYSFDDGRTNYFIMYMLSNDWRERPNIDQCLFNLLTITATTVWTGNIDANQNTFNFSSSNMNEPTIILTED